MADTSVGSFPFVAGSFSSSQERSCEGGRGREGEEGGRKEGGRGREGEEGGREGGRERREGGRKEGGKEGWRKKHCTCTCTCTRSSSMPHIHVHAHVLKVATFFTRNENLTLDSLCTLV